MTENHAPVCVPDLNGDGVAERLAGAKKRKQALVTVLDGKRGKQSFRAFPGKSTSGLQVALADYDGDGRLEILVRQKAKWPTAVSVFSADGSRLATLNADDPRLRA